MNNNLLFQNKLRTLASQHMSSDGAHDILHLDRVWHNAYSIIQHDNLKPDLFVTCASCYLHDIKQYKKDNENNHKSSMLAANYAHTLLTNNFDNISQEQLDNIKHAILAHSFSANITAISLEAKIVQDADRLDSLGAIGIARLFYTSGIIGTALYNDQPHDLDDKKYAIDHIYKKIKKLPDLMHTKYAKKLAIARFEYIALYLRQLKLEGIPVNIIESLPASYLDI